VRRELAGIRADVDHVAETGMRDGAVVALEEVLDRDLPVRVHAVVHAVVGGEPGEIQPARARDLRQRSECRGQRCGVEVRAHEHERTPGVDESTPQPERQAVELRVAVRPRRRTQRAVEARGSASRTS